MALSRHLVTAVLVTSLSVAGLAAAQQAPKGRAGAPEADGAYKIGPEDVLDIAVWDNTAISRTVPVRPDGKISLPLLNEVQAAGLTPLQLRDVLTKALAEYAPNPEVSVIVREVHSFKVSVIGEVKTPGHYELKSRTTVLDVLAKAGPFTDYASRGRIFILRENGTTMTRIPFNYNKVLAADGAHENFFLQPGDIVVVP
jgi:polysaccharide export outer membrane protein